MGCSCSRRSFLQLGALASTALLARPALAGPTSGALSKGTVPVLRPAGAAVVGGLKVLAGSLHDHSTDSDGDAPSIDIAAYVRAHQEELGLDFLSLTEHSDLFPAALGGADPWTRSARVCRDQSGDGFTFLRGFEWTNDQQNHLNVLGSAGWIRRDEGFTMEPFWHWMASAPGPVMTSLAPSLGGNDGIGQFNHPSSKGPLNWDDYAFHAGAAVRMATIEVRERALGWYWFALMRGWTVGPVMNADFHPWAKSGLLANTTPGAGTDRDGFYPALRTLVVARDNSTTALMEALAARRTAASEQPDLWATLRTKEDAWMGSTVTADKKDRLKLVIDAGTSVSSIARVDLVQDLPLDGRVAAHYYRSNNADPTDLDQHRAAFVEQQRRFEASGGKATFKGGQDAPPPGAVVTSVPWETGARTTQIQWQVPTTPSPRPDGLHWVYAIVTRADGARVTTAPLLVTRG